MSKKVLFIAYYFPPLGGSGVQRSLKFVKYLPKFDVEPIVVTVKEGHNFAYDAEMINEISPDTKIYRSNSGETLWLRKQIENVNKILVNIKSKIRKSDIDIKESNETKEAGINNETIKDKVFKYLEYNYYVPDTKIRWYSSAVKDIMGRVLKNEEIDLIFSTSAPYTDHLIALEIKKKTNLPWVADFRDPWVGNKFIYDRYDEKRKAKERKLEAEVVKYADKVINVTEDITNIYKSRYPEFEHKFITITNGFDIADKVETIESSDKFIINYSGIVVDGQSPEVLLKAIESIAEENEQFKRDVLINFTGTICDKYLYLFENDKLKNNIRINSYVPHGVILKEMKNAAINVVILPDTEESKGIYTGKIFDYILSERPILGIMPLGGIASELINSRKIGISVDYNDLDSIKKYIKEVYEKWARREELNTSSIELCSEFNRVNLTGKLVDIFDELIV